MHGESPGGQQPAGSKLVALTATETGTGVAARAQVSSVLPAAPQAGVCLHVTSLPGTRGIGEIGASAREFVDFLADAGLRVWQFLPLGPTGYGDSPYQPLSTFAGNELLIDLGDLADLGLVRKRDTAALEGLPRHTVDYGRLIPAKKHLLSASADRFHDTADAAMQAEFDDFVERHEHDWLHDYALFRILKTQHEERPWMEWAPEYVHRDTSALRRLEKKQAGQINAIKVLQFLFDRQWQRLRRHAHERAVSLFGDLPICIAFDSADAWANRDILRVDDDGRPDFVAGVPPDYFCEDGQLWGNPLYDWAKHAANGYSWWINRLRASAQAADIVRIDHFRGFESYWAVPADSRTARVGSWQPGPGDSLFAALREAMGGLPIVAEDLGVITAEVDALRERNAIPGMHVLQFDVDDEDFSLADIGPNSVCYTGTHDNDTTVGWFHGSPDDLRNPSQIRATQVAALEITDGRPDTIHRDMIRTAFATEARIAIVPMQDFLGLGSEARMNAPGTSTGNWRWRVQDAQLAPSVRDEIAQLVQEAGRT